MDLDEVKVIIRSLITSSQVSCYVKHLLRDFKNETGTDLPLFGYRTPVDFLRSIPDTVRLSSGSNPEVFLVESEKSAHVSSLVEGQRRNPKLNFAKNRVVLHQSQENKENFKQQKNYPRPVLGSNAQSSQANVWNSNTAAHAPPAPQPLMTTNVQPPAAHVPPPPQPLMSTNVQPPPKVNEPAFNITKLMQEVQRHPPVTAPLLNTNMYYNHNIGVDFNAQRNSTILANQLLLATLYCNAQRQAAQFQSSQGLYQAFNNTNNTNYNYYTNVFGSNTKYNQFSSSSSSSGIRPSFVNNSKHSEKIQKAEEPSIPTKVESSTQVENPIELSAETNASSNVQKVESSTQVEFPEQQSVVNNSEVGPNKSVFISRFEREKIRNFLRQRSKGASPSEILGILSINSNKGFQKKLPSTSDIVYYCSDFSELGDDKRLYYKEPTLESEVWEETKPEVVPKNSEENKYFTTQVETQVNHVPLKKEMPKKENNSVIQENDKWDTPKEKEKIPDRKEESKIFEKKETNTLDRKDTTDPFDFDSDDFYLVVKPKPKADRKVLNESRNVTSRSKKAEALKDATDFSYSESSESSRAKNNNDRASEQENRNMQVNELKLCKSTVNDRVQKKLIELMKQFPQGLWCCELPEKYQEIHKSDLDHRHFGYTSLIQMVLELPEIFRCYQIDLGDWLLFDATEPMSEEEIKCFETPVPSSTVPLNIKSDLLKLLESKGVGIFLEDITPSYYKMFRKKLDYESLGFSTIKDLLDTLNGELLRFTKLEKRTLVLPLEKKTDVTKSAGESGESAVPPILPGDDLFFEFFPDEVFGPNEKLPKLPIEKYLEVGSIVEIVVGEVYNPDRFYVLLKEYQENFLAMMAELEQFFTINLNKYEMPDATLQPGQICAAFYNKSDVEEKWHRAEIIRVVNNGRVSVNLVDFGTVETLKRSNLRFLPRNFGELPVQATLSILAGISPPDGGKKWSNDTNRRFLELVSAPSVYLEVLDADFQVTPLEIDTDVSVKREERRLTVKLSEVDVSTMSDIAERLVMEGLAAYSNEIQMRLTEQKPEKKTEPRAITKSTKELKDIEDEFLAQKRKKAMRCSVGVVQPSIRMETASVIPEPRKIVGRNVVSPRMNIPVSPNPFGCQPEPEVFQYQSNFRAATASVSTVSSSKNPTVPHKITIAKSYVASESSFSKTSPGVSTMNLDPMVSPPLRTAAPSNSTEMDFSMPPFVSVPQPQNLTASKLSSPPGLVAPPYVSPPAYGSVPPGFSPSAVSPAAPSATPSCAVPPMTGSTTKSNIDVLSQYLQTLQTRMEYQEIQLEAIRKMEKQQLEDQKKVALLTQHFLTTNKDISAIAQFDPPMALRLATSVAQSFYNNTKSTSLLQMATATSGAAATSTSCASASSNFSATATAASYLSTNASAFVGATANAIPSAVGAATASTGADAAELAARIAMESLTSAYVKPQVPLGSAPVLQDFNVAQFYEKDADALTEKLIPLNIASESAKPPKPSRRYIKEETVEKRILHIFNIEDQPYVCVDQLLRVFTSFSTRGSVDRILASKKVSFKYKIITRREYGPVFDELESYNSFKCDNIDEEFLFLLPLENATKFLHSLQKITPSTLCAFFDVLDNFNPRDDYWTII